MDDQPNRGLYYAGLLALFFLLAFLLAITVFKGKEGPKDHMANKKNAASKMEKKSPQVTPDTEKEPDTTKKEQITEETDSFDFEQPATNTASGDTSGFERMLQSRADSILSSLSSGKRRTDIILRYYPHLPDGKIVYSLSELGFYLHERPTDTAQLDQPTNSLFYGDNVPTADIQLVAYELIRRGVNIKQIKMSKFHDDWKSNSIEIGTDAEAKQLSVLSLFDIQNFKKDQ